MWHRARKNVQSATFMHFGRGRESLKMQMVQEIKLARVYDSALETICPESGPIKPTMWLIVSSETSAAPRAATR
jgi:hypothetical protein